MSADNQFQSLEAQDACEYWTHEAREFTPWLVEAIEADETSDLEDALGIDLEVVDVERAVGRYKIDILARTIEGDRKISSRISWRRPTTTISASASPMRQVSMRM